MSVKAAGCTSVGYDLYGQANTGKCGIGDGSGIGCVKNIKVPATQQFSDQSNRPDAYFMLWVAIDNLDTMLPEALGVFGIPMGDYGEAMAALRHANVDLCFRSYTVK